MVLHSFPTRRSSDLRVGTDSAISIGAADAPALELTEGGGGFGGTPLGGFHYTDGSYPYFSSFLVLGSRGDRKSTRLNSSHGYISYAVFCLKKKILTIIEDAQFHNATLLAIFTVFRYTRSSSCRFSNRTIRSSVSLARERIMPSIYCSIPSA